MIKRTIIVIFCVLALLSLSYYLLFYWLKEAGYESCVLSMEDAFANAVHRPELKQKILITDEWRTLDEYEERLLFDKFISIGRTFDCKQFPEYSDGTTFRGDKGRIKARREGEMIVVRIEVDDGRTRRRH